MNRKFVTLLGIILLTVTITAAAYAHYFKIITVDGTVESGKLDVEWINTATNDCYGLEPGLIVGLIGEYESDTYYDSWAATGTYTNYMKDVALTNAWIEGDTVNMYFDNVYPSYAPMVSVWFENTGTIPAHMEGFEFTYNGEPYYGDPSKDLDYTGGMELIAWEVTKFSRVEKTDVHIYGASKGIYTDLPIPVDETDTRIMCMPKLLAYLMGSDDYGDPSWEYPGIQIHPGEIYDVHLVFHFQEHTPQDSEDTLEPEYNFGMKFIWINWNEDAANPLK